MTDAERLRKAAVVPTDSFPFYGADPVHTPATESATQGDCPACGGAAKDDRGRTIPNRPEADPVRDYECHVRPASRPEDHGALSVRPLTVVCGRCLRTRYEGTAALLRAVKVGQDPRRPPLRIETAPPDLPGATTPLGSLLPAVVGPSRVAQGVVAEAIASGSVPTGKSGLPKGPAGRKLLRRARVIGAGQ